jgi:polysaccharide export outer membrane protein
MAEFDVGHDAKQLSKFLGLFASLLIPPALFAQQKLETAQDINVRIRHLSAAFQGKQSDYVIGGGDVLKIDVFDVPDLSREARVGESGYISLPLLPTKIRVAGLTVFQVEEKLAELLQVNGLVTHPHVTVFVKEQQSQPITVIGAVRFPKVIQAVRQTTLLEILSEAGGISEEAGNVVIVSRPAPPPLPDSKGSEAGSGAGPPAAPETFTVPLKDLLESGDPKFNIPVRGGDVISVPRAGIVYVAGAVTRAGGFVLQSDREEMTVLKLIALAQGLTGTARPADAVILRKDTETGKNREISVNINKVMSRKIEDVRLFPNDILFVPDSTGKKVLRRTGDVALSITSGLVIIRGGR